MRLFTLFAVILLVAAFSMGCAPSSDPDTTAVPTKIPEQTTTPEPAVLAHDLEVLVEPREAAIILLNPRPIGDRKYVQGRTVTIDVSPHPGWEVDEWLGPVFEVAGRTAKINMNVSHSVIIRLVRSSESLPTQTPILGRVAESPLPTAQAITSTSRPVVVPRTSPTPVPQTSIPAPTSVLEPTAEPISPPNPFPVATPPTPTRIPQPTPKVLSSGGLRRGASISGRVSDAETGLPIANVDVAAGPKGVPDSSHLSRVRTDVNGNYTLMGLPEGIIEIHSDDTQGYIGHMDRTVTVGISEEVTGIDYSLHRGATISGRVTDVETGLPISGVKIQAEEVGEGRTRSRDDVGDDGRFTIGGLTPGVYVVTAEGETKGYVRELYDDKHARADAALVAVTGTDAVEGIDFGLKRGATISGRVMDAGTGLPIANMDVKATLGDGDDLSWSETNIYGRYTLKGIPDGVMEVVVAGQGYLQTSKTVTIRGGQNLTGIDF